LKTGTENVNSPDPNLQARAAASDPATATAPDIDAVPMRLAVRIGSIGYLVPIAMAGEIVPIGELAVVPWTQPWYRGLTSLRGRIIGVVDLAQFCGAAPMVEPRPQLLVLGDSLNAGVALIITRAFGLRNLKDLRLVERLSDPSRPWEVARYNDSDGTMLTELDLARLVASDRFRSIGL
jgi:twitching motility protein PilI